ncbi:hypothetical protein HYU19_01905 [Candidatus Woesearchaeota archaeon]|nr:hypothetical protein [Candidatus Woesearchaeota archaeon]
MTTALFIIAAIGFLVSAYAFSVEQRMKQKGFSPACDLRSNISCTKAFGSRYGHLGILPNSLYGMVFYAVVLALLWHGLLSVVFYLSLLSLPGTAYLIYASYFKLKNFCVVCSAIYAVNIALAVASWVVG